MADKNRFSEAASPESAEGPPPEVGETGFGLPMEPADSEAKRLRDQLEEAREQHLRLAAEFDNFRKRISRERVELTDRAQAAFVVKMLEVLDDLDRLVAAESAALSGEALHDALLLIDRKLRKELESAGLESINPDGEPFDPGQHEAVAVLPAADPEQDHHVASTFQTGYRFRGTLIRPARVQVYSAGQDD